MIGLLSASRPGTDTLRAAATRSSRSRTSSTPACGASITPPAAGLRGAAVARPRLLDLPGRPAAHRVARPRGRLRRPVGADPVPRLDHLPHRAPAGVPRRGARARAGAAGAGAAPRRARATPRVRRSSAACSRARASPAATPASLQRALRQAGVASADDVRDLDQRLTELEFRMRLVGRRATAAARAEAPRRRARDARARAAEAPPAASGETGRTARWRRRPT